MLAIIQLLLSGLEIVLAELTKSNAPIEVIEAAKRAIAELQSVHGSVVTKSQVSGLLDTPKW